MSAPLTPAGKAAVADLAQRYHVSEAAVRNLLEAVIRGRGAMAQFSHPDLGGSGQWMRGGMTMVGDMFNSGLQSTVSGICSELSSLMASGAVLATAPVRAEAGAAPGSPGEDWWPAALGRPSSSGGQNDASYAYFPAPRRLAIRRGGAISVYDTGEHSISGVQQQQGGRGSLEFSSQLGTFTVDSLDVVDGGAPDAADASASPVEAPAPDSVPADPAPAAPAPHPATASPRPGAPVGTATTPVEIGAAIEALAGLRDRGILTDDEFTAKKTELLARL